MNAAAQRLLGALRTLDAHDSIKLAGMTRLDIARNINRMLPDVLAFEKAVGRLQREAADPAKRDTIVADISALSEATVDFDLVGVETSALRLDDHPRITGDMIASLAPLLKDFDSQAS